MINYVMIEFSRDGYVSSTPSLNLESQTVCLCPAPPLSKPVQRRWPYQDLGRRPHSPCLFTCRNKAEPSQNMYSHCCILFFFFSEDGSKQRWRCYIGGIPGFLHE
jgi:hypothetical protein